LLRSAKTLGAYLPGMYKVGVSGLHSEILALVTCSLLQQLCTMKQTFDYLIRI